MSTQNSGIENWDDIRAAFHVARLGTLSAAASYLAIHHSTVIRKIDALEQRLGSKLFHRHARGYTPTEVGQELMRVAAVTEEQFTQMVSKLRNRSDQVSGQLVVTTVTALSPWLTPHLVAFQKLHPRLRISLIANDRRLLLEHGEAHVALRAGTKPKELDNVVQHLCVFPATLFAHESYVASVGSFRSDADIPSHRFVVSDIVMSTAPCHLWERENIPDTSVSYRASEVRSVEDAILAGAGIGFLSLWTASRTPNLVEMTPVRPEWKTAVWMTTHSAIHHTAKIQAFSSFLKSRVQMMAAEDPILFGQEPQ